MQIKKADFEVKSAFLRRERDSNPRYLSVRRFSRPVQSTTLPPLQGLFLTRIVVSSCLMVQRYSKKIYHASVSKKILRKNAFFLFVRRE